MSKKFDVVIGVDFGTTYSGFAYAHSQEPEQIFLCENWPDQQAASGKFYCKTQTSLYYAPTGPGGSLELKEWGWSAYVKYLKEAAKYKEQQKEIIGDIASVTDANNNVSYFFTKFKLFLIPEYPKELPSGITVERLITDYLRAMSEFAIGELKEKYGSNRFQKSHVKWCLTVPAIWSEQLKQKMEVCAEKAGMVLGANCRDPCASPHPLAIVLEPEAASIYSQKKLHYLRAGERFLVVDIGGGTIDLASHEKVNDISLQVREINMNSGTIGGGTFVDEHFRKFVCQKIECFDSFSQKNPTIALELQSWWLNRKCGFTGSSSLPWMIPGSLSMAWKEYDEKQGVVREDYTLLAFEQADVCSIFRPEIDKVIGLIEQQFKDMEMVCPLILVGGFSENKYMIECISKKYGKDTTMIPPNPGAAIVTGAVHLGFHSELIRSRVNKRTYGIKCSLPFRKQDPKDSLLHVDGEDFCRTRFSQMAKKGESVEVNSSTSKFTDIFIPMVSDQRVLNITFYSSDSDDPQYITDSGVVKEGSYDLDISAGMHLGKDREVEVSIFFGKSKIEVFATRINFGSSKPERLYLVDVREENAEKATAINQPQLLMPDNATAIKSRTSFWRSPFRGFRRKH